ncbi:phosphate ABC transporter permease PstA [Colwellia sp. 6_MG-2023]|uniref:phosphate ABC transporter permease PstA n=1 Tax=Colwellia sp. 6_MG-2023 TaxID=3062676 RepID=UPI0026E33875|nr:phosphate ABC transporter permease PstA [Colwellia sp. 6_MG-2023]MDO6487133.1 phosphate ABC transporter permease PstA [Colwellia sp. 6_MG-2023]
MTNSIKSSTDNTQMNDSIQQKSTVTITEKVTKSLKKRHRKEKRFKIVGLLAVLFGFMLVLTLITDITAKAIPAFHQHWVKIDVDYKSAWLNIDDTAAATQLTNQMQTANYRKVLRNSIYQMFSTGAEKKLTRQDKRQLTKLFSTNAEFTIKDKLIAKPNYINKKIELWVKLDDDVDSYLKEDFPLGEAGLRVSKKQAEWIAKLSTEQRIDSRFNLSFFTASDSREPELAGIKGALTGTLLTMFVTLLLSFPLGVAGAIYLEEFAPKNRWTDIIEININNLAAVPSIVFGLLGLAVIINMFELPRSAPLVGGIVLTLMTLPTIIIASRAAIKAVPPSLREAALGLGASKMQVTFSHVLPQAMPGIITGGIIGIAQALGETAPLLMIGMVAFIVDVPTSILDSATVLPVQIFLWADSPERAFLAKTSAAILVLLTLLLVINITATVLRSKFEKK